MLSVGYKNSKSLMANFGKPHQKKKRIYSMPFLKSLSLQKEGVSRMSSCRRGHTGRVIEQNSRDTLCTFHPEDQASESNGPTQVTLE